MLTIIAAVSSDGFIGKNGKVPWDIKSDRDFFRKTTTNHTLIMGRKTWDSIPSKFRPLPERRNIIITSQTNLLASGAEVVNSVEEALRLTENSEHVFVIGGAEIYHQTLPFAERLLLTRVDKVVGDGDVKFPDFGSKYWSLVSVTESVKEEKDECAFKIEDYSPNLKYIELANVRTFEQLKVMRQIRRVGHCPFCTENLHLYHNKPMLWNGNYWILTENQWPYPGTNLHLLAILKEHKENIGSLTDGEQQELLSIVRKMENEGTFKGGGICMRSGDPILSGGTVKHLHAMVISPKRGSDSAKFYIGTSKR